MKAIVVEAKSDTPWMLRYPGVLSLDDLSFSLVACPSYATATAFINRWLTLFRECFWTAELQNAVLLPVLREVIRPGHSASVEGIVQRIRLRDKSPAGRACADRLESISLVYPNLYESTANRWDALHENSLRCPIEGTLTPAARFVTSLLIVERFAYLQHLQHRDCGVHTTVFLDEAQTSLSKRQQTISGLPSTLVQLLPTTREHGLQFVVATPSWTELDPLVLSQFQVQIALQPSDGRELDAITKSFPLSQSQARFTSGMQRGTGIGKVRGNQHPFVFTYQPFEQSKDIDDNTRAAARARAERFNATSPNRPAAREGIAPTGQPTPSQKSAPSSAPPSRVAPVVERIGPNTEARNRSPNKERKEVPLNTHQRAFLTHIAEGGTSTVIETYEALGLKPMQGDRIRKKLGPNGLGLLTENRITIGAGRGKQATALQVTDIAYNLLGLQKPRMGRGSGPQHAWILRQLQRLIPHAVIEGIGGADVTVVFNDAAHEHVHSALRTTARRALALNSGDTVAIECELRVAKTGRRNVERNEHFTLTIIAVPSDQLTAARELSSSRVIVLDVFALLDALRLTEPS